VSEEQPPVVDEADTPVDDEIGHAARRSEWLQAHHARWTSPQSLLRDVVRKAGLHATRFERLIAGQANEVHAVMTAGGDELVLRISRRVDPRFEVEAAAIGAARQHGIPAPEVLAVGALEEEDGQTAFILERRIQGVMLRDLILNDERAALPILEQLGELLAGIHEIEVTGFGSLSADLTAGHARCSEWFVDVFVERHLPDTLAAIQDDHDSTALVHRAVEIMTARRDALDAARSTFAHGDVSPTNVLVDSASIAGIVDWEAVKGAPQANDFAWWASGTVSLAGPPNVGCILGGYQRVARLDDDFWLHFEMCQLRIVTGLLGYAASVGDASLHSRARARLHGCVEAITSA
jgi:aminoglycoside phosphotransferase (APT) family kinase protein